MGADEALRRPLRARGKRRWLLASGALMALALGAWWADPGASLEQFLGACKAVRLELAGPVGLGDDAASSALEVPGPSEQEALAEASLPVPLPGQTRPDAKGRCPHPRQVAINGGCWVKLDRDMCEALNRGSTCYEPVFPGERPSTSHPLPLP